MTLIPLVCQAGAARGATFETDSLIIVDISRGMSPQAFNQLARTVNSTFEKILLFWKAEPRVKEFGKIVVELDNSNPRVYSLFSFRRTKEGRTRVVRVSGGGESPHQLAHKLTSAVFPNPDKLVRNMMGEVSEMRFGNPLSFPMCGFDKDEWIAALLRAGSYIPLKRIGRDHGDWGMEIHNNVPKVKDRAIQHASYLEAGSFGSFLIDAYGTERMKQFNLLSITQSRPWQEVFGAPLDELETAWLKAVRTRTAAKEEEIGTLTGLLENDPRTACFLAQDKAQRNNNPSRRSSETSKSPAD